MQGEVVLLFLLPIAAVLAYANLRNAAVYCRTLVRWNAYSSHDVSRWRDTLVLVALLVSAAITGLALAAAPGLGAYVPAYAKVLVFAGTAGVVFSELLERWALRQCERLARRSTCRDSSPF